LHVRVAGLADGGDAAGAIQAYERALQAKDDDIDTLNNLGLLQYETGNMVAAVTTFERLVGLNPGSTAALASLGAASAKAGNLTRAIEAWKSVIRAEPGQWPVRLDLATALWETGDVEGAFFHYSAVAKGNPKSAEAFNGIGLYHLRQGKFPAAEAAFRTSLEARSTFAPAYNNLAVTLEKMTQTSRAIQTLEQGLKIIPSDIPMKKNLSRLRSGG
jgi:tetratricopeptide (TPR) repeat protein